MNFYAIKEIEAKKAADGVDIKVVPGEKMTLVYFYLQPGAEIPEHAHPHEQIGTVLEGSLEINIGTEKKIVKQGEAYVIASNVTHSGKNQQYASTVIEVFSPPRDDLVNM